MASSTFLNNSTYAVDIVKKFSEHADGKTFHITGPSEECLGAEIALSIASASKPSMMILAGRNKTRIMPVIFLIRKMNPKIDIVWIPLNLLDNESVRTAADAIKKVKTDKIHFVINNAGVMAVRDYTTSKQGIESQFAANYLGHFFLTNLLMDRIFAARKEGAIIINVGGLEYELGEVNLHDNNFEGGKTYNAWKAFGQSKTAILLLNTALGKRLADKGVTTLVVHPRKTKLLENSRVDQELLAQAYRLAIERNDALPTQKTVTRQEAAGVVILAALDPRFRESSPTFIVDENIYTATKSYAMSEECAEKLWKLSEELVGGTIQVLENSTRIRSAWINNMH